MSGSFEIELTREQAQDVVALMDAACKAGGLQAAIVAAPIFAKLQAAANGPPEPDEPAEA